MINREPQDVWKWFSEISKIPRESGNEEAISDFCVNFAKERGLKVWQDKVKNVVIHKEASFGYEDRPVVILQGHMDMVAAKSKDSDHNFDTDPIKLIVEGDYLRADNTTLGADNGIAIAIMLAILDDDTIKHPKLECIMTTSEETSMDGILALTNEHLSGKYILNLDTEEEGVFIVSSAGGINVLSYFEKREEAAQGGAIHLKVSNLESGHSGMEINKQRGNALKVLSRILYSVNLEQPLRLSKFFGGSKHNAIPFESEAVLIVKDVQKAKLTIERVKNEILKELEPTDKNAKILIEDTDTPSKALTHLASVSLINFIFLAPHGVFEYSNEIQGLVNTSSNVAILEDKGDSFLALTSIRGSVVSSMRYLVQQFITLTQLNKGEAATSDSYPAWEFEKNSKLKDTALKVYEDFTGKKAQATAIHAGLECGILKELLPKAEAISMGPNIYDVHTEREHIDIPSTERFYNYLKKLLEELE